MNESSVNAFKICGIQTLEEAQMALDAGATTLGFLVGLTHKAEDEISAELAAEIITQLPQNIDKVMVTHLLDAAEIATIADELGVTVIQIHDDLDDAGIKTLKAKLPHIKLIKAVHVMGEDAVAHAKHYDNMPELDALLLDSRTHDRLGGTGLTHDWNISKAIVDACEKPVWLAGGLGDHNVADAVKKVRPAGVDVNSGVEDATGAKDLQKVQGFIQNAKTA
jgi:phosphoribosylanthranilate isomerase